MTTTEIAKRLVELCAKGEFETAQKELFSTDIISIEPQASAAFEKETKGLEKVIEKGDKFAAMTETLHSISMSEPLIAGNSFASTLAMDVTMKGKERMTMTELCVYEVKDSKVISEQFYM